MKYTSRPIQGGLLPLCLWEWILLSSSLGHDSKVADRHGCGKLGGVAYCNPRSQEVPSQVWLHSKTPSHRKEGLKKKENKVGVSAYLLTFPRMEHIPVVDTS